MNSQGDPIVVEVLAFENLVARCFVARGRFGLTGPGYRPDPEQKGVWAPL